MLIICNSGCFCSLLYDKLLVFYVKLTVFDFQVFGGKGEQKHRQIQLIGTAQQVKIPHSSFLVHHMHFFFNVLDLCAKYILQAEVAAENRKCNLFGQKLMK